MICNIIITVVNICFKYMKFILTRKNTLIKTLTHILINKMIKNYKMLKAIISDRNKLFIFKF